MHRANLNRRDFNKLTMAAFGGLLSGAVAGCGGDQQAPTAAGTGSSSTTGTGEVKLTAAQEMLMDEPHVCRGLNACKGLGAGKDNACAGQGICATAAKHDCKGMNDCKGQGGCGNIAGQNACKGQGECAVPLKDETWQKARQAFELAMNAAEKQFAAAPAKS